jgi:hypothetical protein
VHESGAESWLPDEQVRTTHAVPNLRRAHVHTIVQHGREGVRGLMHVYSPVQRLHPRYPQIEASGTVDARARNGDSETAFGLLLFNRHGEPIHFRVGHGEWNSFPAREPVDSDAAADLSVYTVESPTWARSGPAYVQTRLAYEGPVYSRRLTAVTTHFALPASELHPAHGRLIVAKTTFGPDRGVRTDVAHRVVHH